jgi:Protein of unknown function (DUF1566)/K319L-like, PKD domain
MKRFKIFGIAALCAVLLPSLFACGGGKGNTAPVADAGPDQVVAISSLVTLDASTSADADGNPLTYNWSLTSRPEGSSAALSSGTSVNPTFTADKLGSYVASLTVNDGKADSAADTVTVRADTVPVADVGPDLKASLGTVVRLDGSKSTDADGDALTYSWSLTSRPEGSSAALSNATSVMPTFVADALGPYVASLTVNDGKSDSAADAVTITAWPMVVPDTGQTESFTDVFGEDSDYTINPMSFTDNGDGTITDNVTGLVWQRDDNDTPLKESSADEVCQDSTTAGYDDWRLPTKKELMSIVDYGTNTPAIDLASFPDMGAFEYWSSTLLKRNITHAWDIDFSIGEVLFGGKETMSLRSVCVRGSSASKTFTDHGDDTVTDNITGLMWQKADDDEKRVWAEAVNYCEALPLAGYGDWRVPTAKELESITDDTAFNPAVASVFSPSTDYDVPYWSSTAADFDPTDAWAVGFDDGYVQYRDMLLPYHVRCVR